MADRRESARKKARIVWILVLLSGVLVATCLVALVLAYVWRSSGKGTRYVTHFQAQMRGIWLYIAVVLSALLAPNVTVAMLVVGAAQLGMIVFGLAGLRRLSEERTFHLAG